MGLFGAPFFFGFFFLAFFPRFPIFVLFQHYICSPGFITISLLFHHYSSTISSLFHLSFTTISSLFHHSFTPISSLFHHYSSTISSLFHLSFILFSLSNHQIYNEGTHFNTVFILFLYCFYTVFILFLYCFYTVFTHYFVVFSLSNHQIYNEGDTISSFFTLFLTHYFVIFLHCFYTLFRHFFTLFLHTISSFFTLFFNAISSFFYTVFKRYFVIFYTYKLPNKEGANGDFYTVLTRFCPILIVSNPIILHYETVLITLFCALFIVLHYYFTLRDCFNRSILCTFSLFLTPLFSIINHSILYTFHCFTLLFYILFCAIFHCF